MDLFKQYQIGVTELETLLDERIETLIQIKMDIENCFRWIEGRSREEYMKRVFRGAMDFHHALQKITTLIGKDFSRAEVMGNCLAAVPRPLNIEDSIVIGEQVKAYALRQMRVIAIIGSLSDSITESFDAAIRIA